VIGARSANFTTLRMHETEKGVGGVGGVGAVG